MVTVIFHAYRKFDDVIKPTNPARFFFTRFYFLGILKRYHFFAGIVRRLLIIPEELFYTSESIFLDYTSKQFRDMTKISIVSNGAII